MFSGDLINYDWSLNGINSSLKKAIDIQNNLSLGVAIPTQHTLPYYILSAYRNLLAVSIGIGYKID